MKKRKEQEKQGQGRRIQGRKEEDRGQEPMRAPRQYQRKPRVPPPDSTIWPERYRGKRWRPAFAYLFAGKCVLCAYSCPLSKWRQGMDRCTGLPHLLLCSNHPGSPGELVEMLPTETCRNFKAKSWSRPRAVPAPDCPGPPSEKANPSVRRILLSNGMFATVDAADYKRLNKYRWRANRHGGAVYANCNIRGRTVYMHHMILRPRKSYVVDHIDRNTLNNCAHNLRECTPQQNLANRGPRGGSSRFVGVRRRGNKWEAGIRYRGRHLYLGRFDDEVEAAKARDRKAYELYGEHAYLNFPEDYRRRRPPCGKRKPPSHRGAQRRRKVGR